LLDIESDCSAKDFTMKDPNDRRRVDAETQLRRDAEVARLRRANVPFRVIAERLGMSLGAVQKALFRAQKAEAAVPRELDAELTDDLDALENTSTHGMTDSELAELERQLTLAELTADPTNELARYRLRYCP
jgi:hypothetical protein